MKQHLIHYLFSAVILVILVIPITTTVHQGDNDNSILTDSTKNIQDSSVVSSDWLTGWGYRKSHQILGTPGAGVNYQVEIIVNFEAGTDSGNTVYCDSNCQSDFDDIRFTDDDGITLLDYWRETYVVSDNATFWVEVQDNLDSNVSIYVYMSNSTCSTASNGTATFLFFDDFDDGAIDASKWETYGPWTESGGKASFAITGTGAMSILPSLRTDDAWDMRNKSIVSSWRFNEKSVNREWGVSCANTIGDDRTKLAYFIANDNGTHNIYVLYYDVNTAPGYDVFVNPGPIWHEGVFHKTEFISAPKGSLKNQWLLNEELVHSYNDYTFDASLQYIFLGFYVYGYSNTLVTGNLEMEFDYVYLRNQVGIEVTHDTWSDTESILEGWNYRISHMINGAAGAGTNYQIDLVVHYGNGTNLGKDVYCDERCQPDFDDIRFTDDDGITLLDYWTERIYDSHNATFWIEVKDDLDFDTVIYMYYGNATVSSLSNGSATFIAWDDFDLGYSVGDDPKSSRGWSFVDNGTDDILEVAPNPSGRGGNGLRYVNVETISPGMMLENSWDQQFGIALHMKLYWDVRDGQFRFDVLDVDDEDSSVSTWSERQFSYDLRYRDSPTSYLYYSPLYELLEDVWYNIESQCESDAHSLIINDTILSGDVRTTGDGYDHIRIYGHEDYLDDFYIDDFFIRKFVDSEPTHGAWGEYTIISWHHDCSNTVGFTYNDSWNMNWMPWSIQTGTLASDGSTLSVTSVVTGSGWHGPVFEYELPDTFRVRDIENYAAIFDVDNSLNAYTGYEVLMLGDADRNPVMFFSFHDGWSGSCQGSYGAAYVFADGSYVGFGSGYPVGWTSFNGIMNVSYTEAGLLAYVEGHGEGILPGLTEVDFNREIKYIAVASARYGSDPLIPVHIDEIYLNCEIPSVPPAQASINDVEDFWYEASESGNTIEWTIANFNPTSYELWRDEGLLTSDAWPGGTTIEFDINNLSPGEYNYTIVVYGDFDVVVSDTVTVTVVDTTAPILNHPSDVIGNIASTSIQISWQPTDLLPFNYAIYENGTQVDSGTWTSGEYLNYTLDDLTLSSYNITIVVWDTSGNYARDTVLVNIQQESIQPIGDILVISISIGSIGVIVVIVGLICRNKGGVESGPPDSGYSW